MGVCPRCGLDSSGRFFCPRCSALLPPPADALPRRVALPDGRSVDCSDWQGRWPADCWRPLFTTAGGAPCRAYALSPDWWRELAPAVRRRAAFSLDILAPVALTEVAGGAVVVAEALPGGDRPLADPPSGHTELALLEATLAVCGRVAPALERLHAAGLVWLAFDPTALECAAGRCHLANLDLVVFPAGTCPDSVPLLAAYAAPEACAFRAEEVGPATDVYSLGLYAYYALAGLLPDGPPGLGPQAFDFALPPLRVYRPRLPPGVAAVLERATAGAPADRFASVPDFLAALRRVIEQAREDAARPPRALPIDHGAATAHGRAHEVAGCPNQDAYAVVPLPGGLLANVADGVTFATVGSGEIASRLAVESLTAGLPPRLARAASPAEVEAALARGYLEAGAVVLNEALRLAGGQSVDPADLMCTTALVALLRGDEAVLANLGDSRAFLVRDGRAEQLTVDGDVRCALLAAGTPPEQVASMGPEAASLYTCVGVSRPGVSGRPVVCPERGSPRVARFRLRPGDALVLATDGLVEEGAFLGPDDLPPLLAASGSAEEAAAALVAAAQALHRGPSEEEPEGFGDDVTCVVVRVGGA